LRASVQRGTVAIGVFFPEFVVVNQKVGDFNAQPGSLAHRLITIHGLVSDSWLAVHPDSPPRSASSHISNLSDHDKIRLLGVTCDSQLNTWRAYDLKKDMDDPSPKRLDYVFVNQDRVQVQDSTVVFTERVPHLDCSYSDHFGISVKLQLRKQVKDGSETAFSDEGALSHATFDFIDRISEQYLAREIRHSRWRNRHFIASVLVFIGLLIGQWWVKPNYGHFIILLVAVVVMVTGTVDGLIGFIFGRWEIRALREFISEVRLARKVYLGDLSNEYH
jgi:sphingomyelin phosphodiesterase 2